MVSNRFRNMALVLLACALSACSKRYTPRSEREAVYFKKAAFCLYPDDVRTLEPNAWDTLVVWPGLLKRFDLRKIDSNLTADLVIEHHFYDWILDFGTQKEKIFLSPLGEGLFKTRWVFPPKADSNAIKSASKLDDLLIVYGKPTSVIGDTVHLTAAYINPIDKQWYTTKMWDYGRDSCKVDRNSSSRE